MKSLENLNYNFWKFFKEISTIPRQSGNEEKIADYLVNFSKNRNLKYYRDNINNVIIWKNASRENKYCETIGLQCHTDMVCEKKANSKHDFFTDPLELIIEENFIKATDTTLGADNGIGIAYILAILDSSQLKTPNLECIFTVQEETTMNGAKELDYSLLHAKKIISFDNFRENEMWISSASADEWEAIIDIKETSLNPLNYSTFSLNLSHFKGGHSGFDIADCTRINPIKLIAKLLKNFSDIYISELVGGTKTNIIPRECKIVFSINNFEIEKTNKLKDEIKKILIDCPDTQIYLSKIDTIEKCYSKAVSKNILNFLTNFRNGALIKDNLGNVILSANLAAINSTPNAVNILYSTRYNSKILGNNLKKEILNLMQQYNITMKNYSHILGYEQSENSKLINTCQNLYLKFFNEEFKIIKVQACLECGYFADKIPNLQFIAIAPSIYNAHSPSEKLSIKSADKMWNFICKLIENIK